jgi:G3E family GTPase
MQQHTRCSASTEHPPPSPAGLANPAPVINTFFANQDLVSRVRLDGLVTVVDAKHVRRICAPFPVRWRHFAPADVDVQSTLT